MSAKHTPGSHQSLVRRRWMRRGGASTRRTSAYRSSDRIEIALDLLALRRGQVGLV